MLLSYVFNSIEELLFNIIVLMITGFFRLPPFLVHCLIILVQSSIELAVLLVNTLKQKPVVHHLPPPQYGFKPSPYKPVSFVAWPPKTYNSPAPTIIHPAPLPYDVQLARYQQSAHTYNCFKSYFYGTGPYRNGIPSASTSTNNDINYTFTNTAPAGPDYLAITRQLRIIGRQLAAALKTIDSAMNDPTKLTQYCTDLNLQLLKPCLDEMKLVTSALPVAGLPTLGVFKAALEWPTTELKKLHDTIEDEEIENPNGVPDEILQLQVSIEAVFKQLGVELL
ncbi:hypothetical protein BDV96DRAFT_640697 [Lophiotrema nucula]|uniref:Uncharacterized protein n=1 Tax=Lophiotrema nucula TaxID=690887 RepID=A0A6A5ZNR0_9PLEO|nr:hypothetical protein BDV96DRAFT_640697 [Lophiotrema nucula]